MVPAARSVAVFHFLVVASSVVPVAHLTPVSIVLSALVGTRAPRTCASAAIALLKMVQALYCLLASKVPVRAIECLTLHLSVLSLAQVIVAAAAAVAS